MRFFIYGSRSVLLTAILLGLFGCQESNESIAEAQAKKTEGTVVKETAPPPKDQREFGERSLKNNPLAKGYPTAPAKK